MTAYTTATQRNVTVSFTPEYFRRSALSYNGSDRRIWLEKEIVNLQAAIFQYQSAVMDLMQRGANLDGVNDVATWLTRIGASVGSVTTGMPYVSIISWAVAGVGAIWNAFEKKKDRRSAQSLMSEAQRLQVEAQEIERLYNQYSRELQLLKLRPLLIGAAIGIIAYRK